MSDRLSREDWVEAGLRALAAHGHEELKADRLARRLGVSRGSFYWHFADLAAFHVAVLEHWRVRYADAIIASLDSEPSARAKLTQLLRRTVGADPSLEAALRAWSVSDDVARRVVDATDQVRVSYVAELLREHGVHADHAEPRAHVAYWAYLGQAVAATRPSPELSTLAVAELVRMVLGA